MNNTIQQLRLFRCRVGIAISPDTPFEAISPYFSAVDRILMMTVYPGFVGQKLLSNMRPKVGEISEAAKATVKRYLEIGIDGGVDVHSIADVMWHSGRNECSSCRAQRA